MALLDFSEVTSSLIELLTQAFNASPAWTPIMGSPNVLPEPPSRIINDGIGVYLYHVQEKKEYSNFPVTGNNAPPVRYLPTALSLYYQVSANSPVTDAATSGAISEQLMMSIAIKAFHDYPVLDDLSTINGTPFFPPGMRGKDNRFKITQLPVTYSDAVQNWTAGSAAMKLSAYYEVSVIFLEPEETTSYSSRVLMYGNYIFASGAPFILSGQSTITFRLPGELSNREVNVQPGQGTPGNVITFFGSGFTADEIGLRILPPGSSQALLADASWNVSVTAINKLIFTVQNKAIRESDGVQVDLLPGMYSAQVIATKILRLPNGDIRRIKNSSNQFPFVITPSVSIGAFAGNVVTVTGFTFQDPAIIEIYLGADKLARNTGGPFAANEFRITAPGTIEINLPGPLAHGQMFPLRLVIGGAESAPSWIVVP